MSDEAFQCPAHQDVKVSLDGGLALEPFAEFAARIKDCLCQRHVRTPLLSMMSRLR